MTQLLSLPFLKCSASIYNNSDWLDGLPFLSPPGVSTIAFTINPINLSNIQINGTIVTFVTSGASGNQVNIGPDLSTTLASLHTFLNASTDPNLVTASYDLSAQTLNITTTLPKQTISLGGSVQGITLSLVPAIPFDLTGIDFHAQLREKPTSVGVVVDMTIANTYLVNGGTSGILNFAVPASILKNLPAGEYACDILGIAERTITVATVDVTITQGVTR